MVIRYLSNSRKSALLLTYRLCFSNSMVYIGYHKLFAEPRLSGLAMQIGSSTACITTTTSNLSPTTPGHRFIWNPLQSYNCSASDRRPMSHIFMAIWTCIMRRKRSLSNHHCLLQFVSQRKITICASTVEGRTISSRSYPG